MTDEADIHRRLAQEFVQKVVRETRSQAGLMVVVETVIFGAMFANQRIHKMTPAASAEMIETAIHSATERFAVAMARKIGAGK